jgi:hypothetical protein
VPASCVLHLDVRCDAFFLDAYVYSVGDDGR